MVEEAAGIAAAAPPRNRTCGFPAYGSSNCLWHPQLVVTDALSPFASCAIDTDLSCPQCFRAGSDSLLTPLLHLLSQASSLL